MMTILLYLGIGLVIGTVSGTLGIGGGVLLVPALMWLMPGDFDQRTAAGTTLAVLVVPVVLPAVVKYAQKDAIDVVAACWIAASFGIGSFLGAYLHTENYLPEHTLRIAFGLMLVYVGVRFLNLSDSEAVRAAAALTAVAAAWVGHVALRALGRRHARPPAVKEKIQALEEKGYGDPDYMI